MRGAEKPGGDAMPSLFSLTFPPSSDRWALFSVVVSLREVVPCFSMVRFTIPSTVK